LITVKEFDHPADIEVEIEGESLKEVFEGCANYMLSCMFRVEKIDERIERKIEVSSEDLESLLYDFLEEILFLIDSENLAFKRVKVIELDEARRKVSAVCYGEVYEREKHGSGVVIKAVTYHEMKVGKRDGKFFAHVVFDI